MSRRELRRVRTFIAFDLASGVKHRANEIIKKLKQVDADVKWINPQEMHVTLKFLGEIRYDEILPLCRLTQEITAAFKPFDIGFSGLGAFPNADEPRTIWIGIEEGLAQLQALQKTLDEALSKKLGFPRERRLFTPHLTIGRVHRCTPELIAKLDSLATFESDFTDVDELVIYASFPDKTGPSYEALGHAVLGKMPQPEDDDDDDLDDEEDDEMGDNVDVEDGEEDFGDEFSESDFDDLEDEDFEDEEDSDDEPDNDPPQKSPGGRGRRR